VQWDANSGRSVGTETEMPLAQECAGSGYECREDRIATKTTEAMCENRRWN